MYLELADCSGSCTKTKALIPVVDPGTGQIMKMNPRAFALLSREEQQDAKRDLPQLIELMTSNLGEGTGTMNVPSEVQEFIRQQQADINSGRQTFGLPGFDNWVAETFPPYAANPNNRYSDTYSGGTEFSPADGMGYTDPNGNRINVNVDPTVKPWFATAGVVVPVAIGVLGVVYLITRPRK